MNTIFALSLEVLGCIKIFKLGKMALPGVFIHLFVCLFVYFIFASKKLYKVFKLEKWPFKGYLFVCLFLFYFCK